MATTCGVVERVNKLVSVRPLRSRYGAEVGDVVVGRVLEVSRARQQRCATAERAPSGRSAPRAAAAQALAEPPAWPACPTWVGRGSSWPVGWRRRAGQGGRVVPPLSPSHRQPPLTVRLPAARAQVAGKRWRVDLGSKGEATLLLSAVNLPGGVQRRRTAEDELNMRALFAEGDAISVGARAGGPHAWGGRMCCAAHGCVVGLQPSERRRVSYGAGARTRRPTAGLIAAGSKP